MNGPRAAASPSTEPVSGVDVARNGEVLRAWRKAHGMSQANLARSSGVTQALISAHELGKRQLQSGHVKAIASVIAEVESGSIPEGIRLRNWAEKRSAGQEPKPKRARRRKKVHPADHVAFLNRSRGLERPSLRRSDEDGGAPVALAMFAGCGGMSLGFRRAGFDVAGFIELDENARESYAHNFPTSVCLGADVTEVSRDTVAQWRREFGEVAVLIGGPPCQGFSLAGKRDVHDPRNRLVMRYLEIAEQLQPKAILIENVRLLTSMKNPSGGLVADEIVEQLQKIGYRAQWSCLNSADYGVPQCRERVFFLGYRQDLAPPSKWFPAPTHSPVGSNGTQRGLFSKPVWRSFRDATGDLPSLESGERAPDDEYHWAVSHPEHVLQMLRVVPEGHSAHENEDPALRPPSGYNTTYKRLRWDEPSSTIGTTFGMISACRTVHPTNTRSLTIREAMRCQSFPDDFQLKGKTGAVRKQIGNAVPPVLAEALAGYIKTHLPH
ncbi:MAG: DNA (cytosine-5-)-methyltransferase [Deltaproteobacteria bacterium]|nr:MAG: DNA (cytosine-5-)-methyltransferase [Deltaproteobacteria bacterium]